MPRFAYTARDRSGQAVAAELDSPSRKDALRVLTARGLQVSAVNEVAVKAAKPGKAAVAKAAAAVATPKSARAAKAADSPQAPRRAE